jgi:hypothetical protein
MEAFFFFFNLKWYKMIVMSEVVLGTCSCFLWYILVSLPCTCKAICSKKPALDVLVRKAQLLLVKAVLFYLTFTDRMISSEVSSAFLIMQERIFFNNFSTYATNHANPSL